MRLNFRKFLYACPALALIAGAVIVDFSSYARAEDAGFSDTQKAEIQQVIKAYLRDNPEVVIESLKIYQEREQQNSQEAAQAKIAEYKTQLTKEGLPGAGNPKGDVTVIEFFDYNCGYCKKAMHDVQAVLDSDKNVRFVLFEFPILSESSHTAAKWAHAAHKQGKYFEFHTALMNHNGAIDESVLESTAKKLSLDVEKLKRDAASPELEKELKEHIDIAHAIGIQGTPGFIVGTELFPGYIGEDGLKEAIKTAREGKKD